MRKRILALLVLPLMTTGYAQVRPEQITLTNEKSFSLLVIPDPQSYIKFEANQPILDIMTTWCAKHLEKLNVASVICTGDLVEQNDISVGHGVNGDQNSEQQWRAVSNSFSKLDGKNPYIVCTGNHDYGYNNAEIRKTQLNSYFPSERNSLWERHLVETADNAEGVPTLENAAYTFEQEHWGKILVLSLEFAPRDEIIEWAKGICKKYSSHRIILLTHSYMETDAIRYEDEGYGVQDTNYGSSIWEKLVSKSPNIRFVICGHACNTGGIEHSVSFRTDENDEGAGIPQMMFNAQTADGEWFGNGGDGWLRILEFLPDGETVFVRTYSPLLGISKLTVDKAWRRESYDQFEFKIHKL